MNTKKANGERLLKLYGIYGFERRINMKYLYDSHMGGIYTSDELYDYDSIYCETCGDYDEVLGGFTTIQDFWDLIKGRCSINGSGGYSLQYIYPIIVEEFDLPDDVKYKDDYEREYGCCCNSEDEILSRIEELLKDDGTTYLDIAQNKIDAYFREHKIPDYFYQCLFGELIKVFGTYIIEPDKDYLAEYDDDGNLIALNEEDYSYKDQLDFYLNNLVGTSGWHLAFEEACKQCDMMELYQYDNDLNWVQSDMFEGHITDEMISCIFSNDRINAYYRFKFNDKGE